MKRNVIGYSLMADNIINNELSGASFFFASPQSTMMGLGKQSVFFEPISFKRLAEKSRQMLSGAKLNTDDNPVLFGVIPFDEKTPTRLVIPEQLYVSSSTRATTERAASVAKSARVISAASGMGYKQGVEEALHRFSTSELSKVVLSRALEVATEDDIEESGLLKNLLKINSKGYTFAVDIGDCSKLMGASPELLVAKRGSYLTSNPLAGSRPRQNSEQENEKSRLSLLNTAKDLHEHGLVVEEVERVLSRHCRNLYTPMVPSVIETNTMLHLSTLLEGQASNPDINVLEVAAELHPTPAVCGFPRHQAYRAIQDIEQFDRGYFTGMVGWCDARGNGEWVVTIRCAEVQKRLMRVFAGAGIVSESHPQSELDETGAKMKTMLSAAGIQLDESAHA
ncbi:isochorismate synthase [Thaumasiovibrio subtropicus]|uniref:isochorismate synthase n=1 Tax=Thaumasiovibrio subtropicus TaxID=1891207 RepID=UPI000B362FF5|nr:isochorismate synthase [Thaumasiovibrio subtropicus]